MARRVLSLFAGGSLSGLNPRAALPSVNLALTHNRKASTLSGERSPRVLITGGCGQLGSALARKMRSLYGTENVILSDIVMPTDDIVNNGPYRFADVLDFKCLQEIIVNNRIDWVVHFSALLSAVAEQNTALALRVNVEGLHNVLELAKQYQLRLFVPSTIGAFGVTSPRNPTPDITIQRPSTMYGVGKVHAELMGEYYHTRFGLDFRCLRLPGVISADSNPGGGTTDYAVTIFHEALKTGKFKCYLRPDSRLPMIYIDDCIRGMIQIMEADVSTLPQRTYNIQAMSFTPEELVAEIHRHIPHLEVSYAPDFRQNIADSWPEVLDDQLARRDWGWRHDVGISELVEIMISYLKHHGAR